MAGYRVLQGMGVGVERGEGWPRPYLLPNRVVTTVYLRECQCPEGQRRCPVKERGVCGNCGGAVVGPLELFSHDAPGAAHNKRRVP